MPRIKVAVALFGLMTLASPSWTADLSRLNMALPSPQVQGGRPLMQALLDRQSSRAFSSRQLPGQVLSDLLWAAAGINRPQSGKRTAPSARNWQEVEVYVVMEEGAYQYDAKSHSLKAVAQGDLRTRRLIARLGGFSSREGTCQDQDAADGQGRTQGNRHFSLLLQFAADRWQQVR